MHSRNRKIRLRQSVLSSSRVLTTSKVFAVETGWETVLEEAKEAGIPVILSDRQMQLSDDSLYEAWVGGNFVKEGRDLRRLAG